MISHSTGVNTIKYLARKTLGPVLLWLILVCLPTSPALAKHLVGGSVTYKFIQVINGYYQYRITVDMFRDCLDPQAPRLDDSIIMGFYEASGNSSAIFTSLSIPMVSLDNVNPVSGGSKCSFVPQTCLQHGTYIADVYLQYSTNGYYMEYMRCCRNSIDNINYNSGYNYWGFISPTSDQNTSPAFTDVPVPYICVNDTVTLNFSATEPDGDSITYTLATPYSGANNGNPNPQPPQYYKIPDTISYISKYFSANNPFGSLSYCKLDKTTGLLKVFAPSIGRYAVAIDYREYRNGKQINRTRRDVQFIVISCPYNPAPVRQSVNGSQPTDYYIDGGQSFNFNVNFSDPNKDSISLSASGTIFQKSPNPAALEILNASAPSNQTGNIIWNTRCKDISTQPYQVYIKAQDHGCPPKSTIQVLNLYVQGPAKPSGIFGPNVACGTLDTFTYMAYPMGNTHLVWGVTGGLIVSSSNTNRINVVWQNGVSKGKIKVVAINNSGCVGDTVYLNVKIIPKHLVSSISGPPAICIDQKATYIITGSDLFAMFWSYGNGALISRSSNSISVNWNQPGNEQVQAIVKDSNGCTTDTLRLNVWVSKPVADSIYGSTSICPNAKRIEYITQFQKGSKYYWKISGGLQVSGGNTNDITVNWGNKGTGIVKVVEITSAGCIGDTVTIYITIDYKLITPQIKGDSEICENTAGKIYYVINSNNSNYTWQVTGGNLISGQGTSKISINWGSAGTGLIAVQQTAYDSVNNEACIAAPVILNIKIDSTPNTSPISGNSTGCAGNLLSYKVLGMSGSRFYWSVNTSNFFLNQQGFDSISIVFTKPGYYIIKVQETSKNNCPGMVQTKNIFIDSIPNTSEISGPDAICWPDFPGKVYKVKGDALSTYAWTIEGGIIVAGNGTPKIIVNWSKAGIGKISVIETSSFGCSGSARTLNVKVDSLELSMDLVTTSRSNDNQIEIYWHASDAEFFNGDVLVYRSSDPLHQGYRQIASVPSTQTEYIDKAVSTHALSYYYKIEAVNICGNLVSSNVHRTILLNNLPPQDSIINLKWNPYQGWINGVDQYFIYKTVNTDTTLSFYNFTPDTNAISYTDLVGYRQCFRVSATEKGNASIISWSNEICIDIDPQLWIPNIFTPNNDNVNNKWRIVVTNIKAFKADVYNRWGEHIFSSTDPDLQWDGTFHGKVCPEGVYLYMVQVDGIRKNIYRNGTVQLLR
jgi:gliding motility-associated-like protein